MAEIDLHIHTCFSDDGEFSPSQIAAQCREQGIRLAAVTDHNTVRGVPKALADAKDGALQVLSGVELDCTYRGRNFHLLGYCFNCCREEFKEIEQDILRQERAAAEKKLYLFQKTAGVPVDAAAVLEAAKDGVVTGELIAEFVLAREDAAEYEILSPYLPGGEKSDMPNVRFYWDFFSEGRPAHVPIHYLSLSDAAALLHRAGGFTVLAHPGQNLKSGDESLLAGLLTEGIDGIEAFSSYHGEAKAAHYLEIARKHHLLVTCGSDFHGRQKPGIRLGGHGAAARAEREFCRELELWLAART